MAGNEVSAFSLARGEGANDLGMQMIVHGGRTRSQLSSRTCPAMFMIAIVLVLLHTTMWSGFFGNRCTLLTWMSPPAVELPRDLNVLMHSLVFVFHIFTVPSEEPLQARSVRATGYYL